MDEFDTLPEVVVSAEVPEAVVAAPSETEALHARIAMLEQAFRDRGISVP